MNVDLSWIVTEMKLDLADKMSKDKREKRYEYYLKRAYNLGHAAAKEEIRNVLGVQGVE